MFAARNMMFAGVSLDPAAAAYIAAVEQADTQALEPLVRKAYDDFFRGIRADGILAKMGVMRLPGARTLTGHLINAVNPATSYSSFVFSSGDYNRVTGLLGNGTDKYLDCNRSNNADPQDDQSMWAYQTAIGTSASIRNIIGAGVTAAGTTRISHGTTVANLLTRNRSATQTTTAGYNVAGFIGMSRSGSSGYQLRGNNAEITISVASDGVSSLNNFEYCRNGSDGFSDHRASASGIGASISLSAMQTRIENLVAAIAAAIT